MGQGWQEGLLRRMLAHRGAANGGEMMREAQTEEQRIARLITSSIAGTRWRDLTPLDIARHLVANGVRVAVEVE
jgi:hypothetical protein